MSEIGVEIRQNDSVLEIVLARANSTLSRAMIVDIVDALAEADQQSTVRAIVMTSSSRNFCTGMDLVESNKSTDRKPRVGNHQRRISDQGHRLVRALLDVQLPLIVGVRGWAAGIGLAVTLCADYVVADTSAKFWAPYAARGFTPDSGTTYLLPRAIGTLRAKTMLMRAKPTDAETAFAWGLVNEVVEPDRLDWAVSDIVDEMSSAATVSVGLTRALIHRNADADIGMALHNEEFGEEVSLRSMDFREGIAALRERRTPKFEGQ